MCLLSAPAALSTKAVSSETVPTLSALVLVDGAAPTADGALAGVVTALAIGLADYPLMASSSAIRAVPGSFARRAFLSHDNLPPLVE